MFAVSEQEYLLSKCYFTEQRITNKHETRFLLILWKKKIMYRYFKEYRYPSSLYMKIMTSVICATNHALSWYFLRIEENFFKEEECGETMGFFFTITTRHHTNPHNPSKSTSVVSWRLPDTAVLLPGLGSISKMLSSLTLYQFYILHCVYIERKKDKGEEKIMASCIRGGEIKRRSSRSLSKFRLTLHPLSLIP